MHSYFSTFHSCSSALVVFPRFILSLYHPFSCDSQPHPTFLYVLTSLLSSCLFALHVLLCCTIFFFFFFINHFSSSSLHRHTFLKRAYPCIIHLYSRVPMLPVLQDSCAPLPSTSSLGARRKKNCCVRLRHVTLEGGGKGETVRDGDENEWREGEEG